ncbi:MAG: hypothetical protein ACREHC_09030, partial [Candidatus Levyibacteriota bacterium]
TTPRIARSFFMAETYRPTFDYQATQPFIPVQQFSPEARVPYVFNQQEEDRPGSSVDRYIKHFDRNWKKEGLPHDWYRLQNKSGKQIGFSLNSQMELLTDPTDRLVVEDWTQKTKQDLLGFKLEYLTDHIVYPCTYVRSATDPTRLESPLYGNADITETVSAEERNGSVKEALGEMKSFLLSEDTPDESVAIMFSPRGETGLTTDAGKAIKYPDSYFFIMQKDGDTVKNYTLKTDFSVAECREAIYQLTGKLLPVTAPIEDYVRAVAKIKPGDHGATPQVEDIVGVLEQVRPEYAFKPTGGDEKTGWADVYRDIAQSDQLYNFNAKTQEIIAEFEAYCVSGEYTKEDYQKALAATILRLSKVFFVEEQQATPETRMSQGLWVDIKPHVYTFGDALGAAMLRPGCAGGGQITSFLGNSTAVVNSVTPRLATSEDRYGSLEFECPKGHKNTSPRGELIPECKTCGVSVSC